jgi:hypothetical protein
MTIWCFFFNKTFEVNFLKFKRPNLKKNLIRQKSVPLLFCELYHLSTLQMKTK